MDHKVRTVTKDELDASKHIKFCCTIGDGHIVYGSADAIVAAFKMNEELESRRDKQ